MTGRIGTNDGSCFRQTVSLEHRNADGTKITLKFDIQQGAAAYEELHPPAEPFAYILENELVKKFDERLFPALRPAAGIVILLIIGNGQPEGELVQFLHFGAFLTHARFDVFAEIACQRRHRKHHHRTNLADGDRDIFECGYRSLSYRHRRNAAAIRHHGIETRYVGETMVQRQDNQHHIVHIDADYGMRLLHVGRVIAMGEQDSLRIGCRAGGIADIGIIVRSHTPVPGHERIIVRFQEGIAARLDFFHGDLLRTVFRQLVKNDHLFHLVQLRQDRANLGKLLGRNHHETGVRMTNAEEQVVAFFQFDGERNIHASGVQDSQFPDNPKIPSF